MKSNEKFISEKIVLRETKNANKRITKIFTILTEDKNFIAKLFDKFTAWLTVRFGRISELIVDVDFTLNKLMKDFQFNHSIWLVINVIRKMLFSLKNKELSSNSEFAHKFESNDKTIELDAVKSKIEQLLGNQLF